MGEVALALGPTTEDRFREAFAEGALITAKAAAALLGLDVETLGAMTDDGAIRAVRPGRVRKYTEADLRAFLTEAPNAPPRCDTRSLREPAQPRGRVVPFSARPKHR